MTDINSKSIKMKGGINKMGCYGMCVQQSGEMHRGFLTKKEKLEMLTEYKESLSKELQGVSERIKEIEDEE